MQTLNQNSEYGLGNKTTSADISTPHESSSINILANHGTSDQIPITQEADSNDSNNPREIILQSFLPTVAVFASRDTEELIRLKGIYGGLCGLLKPFGEQIHGKVIVRDSSGGSKGWTNYGVHFVDFGKEIETTTWSKAQDGGSSTAQGTTDLTSKSLQNNELKTFTIDEAILKKLEYDDPQERPEVANFESPVKKTTSSTPDYYAHYLRKLLAERPILPYEPYTHPVACIITISSQCHGPIETLRDLYRENSIRAPEWTGREFLRYYVLVHDEDHDDIASSTSLFNQMKRHFGLHCHLLRLRTVECGPNDEDSMRLPTCTSLPAADEILTFKRKEQNGGVDDLEQYLFDTDAAVIRTFVREMVTQSVIPFMEGRVTAWNDQVASKRRGLGGRFMNLSKRFTGFGSTRGSKSSTTGSTSSYVIEHGYYEASSNEAIMHRLADFSFMLRDWKLSTSIYDILKTDFGDDKAWHHQARAHEMLALGMLLGTDITTSQPKSENIDQAIEIATYSHATRCGDTRAALRCLTLVIELYAQVKGSSTEEAIKWSDRLLELTVLSPVEQVMLAERLAFFYSLRLGTGLLNWETRVRKAAFWNLLAAEVWLSLSRLSNATSRFLYAKELYSLQDQDGKLPIFSSMESLWQELSYRLDPKEQLSKTMDLLSTDEEEHPQQDVEIYDIPAPSEIARHRLSTAYLENVTLLQRLHDPLGQEDDGFM